MINIKHLKKEYPNVTPLKDVNIDINKGEIISIIGPSGTGKSTLLRCLNMLEEPSGGQIIVDGEDICAKGYNLSNLRKRMGMVFQQFNLFRHMNVLENLCFAPIKLQGLSKEEAEKKAIELLKTVSLVDKAYNYPDELSGGQQQRIAIARALAMDPEIILFDEPTSALDPAMTAEVLAVIRLLAQKGLTMLIVTHEMQFAKEVSTRILYMDQGIVYEDGTPEQIFNNPQKELTRRFVNNLKILDLEIKNNQFDFIGQIAEIENFGRKSMMNRRAIYEAETIYEELCIQTLLSRFDSLRFVLEPSLNNKSTILTIRYEAGEYNPFYEMNPISEKLINNASEETAYEFDGKENIIKIKLKQ